MIMTKSLSPLRRFTQPKPGDDWESIAARELPQVPPADAVGALKSWNLHVAFRPASVITPSDVIFVEPPRSPAPAA